MDRKEFIKTSCTACISLAVLGTLVNSCSPASFIAGEIGKDGLTIRRSDFRKAGYLIVKNDALQHPICVFKLDQDKYSALWMKCTHQGATLQASGDVLTCPAHGSEFNNKGEIIKGPAGSNLRSFPVMINNDNLFIDLRKIS